MTTNAKHIFQPLTVGPRPYSNDPKALSDWLVASVHQIANWSHRAPVSGALSVLGQPLDKDGPVQAIAAGTDKDVLQRVGTTLAFAPLALGTLGAKTVLEGTVVYDPATLADGAGVTTTVTVTGAVLGNMALVSFSLATSGITITAWVSAANTVSVRFQNETGGVLDIGSGTLKAWVLQ